MIGNTVVQVTSYLMKVASDERTWVAKSHATLSKNLRSWTRIVRDIRVYRPSWSQRTIYFYSLAILSNSVVLRLAYYRHRILIVFNNIRGVGDPLDIRNLRSRSERASLGDHMIAV